jgi:hypothetical protein
MWRQHGRAYGEPGAIHGEITATAERAMEE